MGICKPAVQAVLLQLDCDVDTTCLCGWLLTSGHEALLHVACQAQGCILLAVDHLVPIHLYSLFCTPEPQECCLSPKSTHLRHAHALVIYTRRLYVAAHREREAAHKRHTEALQLLNQRLGDLDADNRALREAKMTVEGKASELACRLGVAEGAARALEDESAHLRGVASSAARDKADRDAEASDLRARLRLADDKVSPVRSLQICFRDVAPVS